MCLSVVTGACSVVTHKLLLFLRFSLVRIGKCLIVTHLQFWYCIDTFQQRTNGIKEPKCSFKCNFRNKLNLLHILMFKVNLWRVVTTSTCPKDCCCSFAFSRTENLSIELLSFWFVRLYIYIYMCG